MKKYKTIMYNLVTSTNVILIMTLCQDIITLQKTLHYLPNQTLWVISRILKDNTMDYRFMFNPNA